MLNKNFGTTRKKIERIFSVATENAQKHGLVELQATINGILMLVVSVDVEAIDGDMALFGAQYMINPANIKDITIHDYYCFQYANPNLEWHSFMKIAEDKFKVYGELTMDIQINKIYPITRGTNLNVSIEMLSDEEHILNVSSYSIDWGNRKEPKLKNVYKNIN